MQISAQNTGTSQRAVASQIQNDRANVGSAEVADTYVPGQNDVAAAFARIPTPAHSVKARLLADNFEAWNQRWKLLESAQSEINTTYYTWDNDIFGRALLGHTFLKARQGVDVTLMVDAVGDPVGKRGLKSHRGGEDYLQEVVALPNAQARVYHPHYKKIISFFQHPTKLDGVAANHDKILEVDGREAITGGRNMGHHYYIHPADDPIAWRDTDIHLVGHDAALDLRDAINVEYDRKLLHHVVRPDLLGNWKKRDIELLGDYAMMDAWVKGQGEAPSAEALVAQAVARLPELGVERKPNDREREHLLKSAHELTHNAHLRGSYHDKPSAQHEVTAKVIDKTSAVGTGLNEMNATFADLAHSAQRQIDIQSPYFVLTDEIIDTFKEASDRGVKIRVATNTPTSSDSYFTQVFFLNDWKKLLAEIPTLELYGATGERKTHGKVAVFDDRISVVGTYNVDLISSHANGEVAAVIDSPVFAAETTASIESDYANPTLGYQQYQIARNDQGQPVDANGISVLDEQGHLIGEPLTVFGPENHVDPAALHAYDKKIKKWNWMRRNLPQLRSLRRNEGT